MAASSRSTHKKDPRASRRRKVSRLLSKVQKKLSADDTKATLADFVRLTQLERELEEEEQPREIVITWVDPTEREDIET